MRREAGRPEPRRPDPVVAHGSPRGWRAWLARTRRERPGQVGLALGLGFGAALLCLWALTDLAEDVASRETEQIDAAVLNWLHQFRAPALDWSALVVSLFGSELVYVLAGVVGVLLIRPRRWGAAVSLWIVTGGAELLDTILKAGFHRTRPEALQMVFLAEGFAFPSGHAMAAAAFYFFVAYLSWRLLEGGPRVVYTAALLVLVLLIGWSRLHLGVHYLTDVVAGLLAGFLWQARWSSAGYSWRVASAQVSVQPLCGTGTREGGGLPRSAASNMPRLYRVAGAVASSQPCPHSGGAEPLPSDER